MTEGQFNKIYTDSLTMCRIKCMNNKRREAIKQYKNYLKNGNLKYSTSMKEQIKKHYWHLDCYDCYCLPDEKNMLKLINKAVK